ncbi:DUF695 domain-containing protein [Ohtaekwangia sp.]|uniref:DUF695 domain-containing protein n=1 Tax=Ohtaekwangia sp. TaxID=2066019 RepID=UPI002F93B324
MNLLKKLFKKEDEPIRTYADFWNWFQKNERALFKAIKTKDNIEKDFFDKLSPRLNELREGLHFVTGMQDDNTASLVLTADGVIKNIAFIEELVSAAPQIKGWEFIAHKPAQDMANANITMAGHEFHTGNLYFFSNDHKHLPDEIDITVVHNDLTEENKDSITNGTYIFLDHCLGELNFATIIDNVTVIGKDEAPKELIPIEKLKSYLTWREKEFVEKYDHTLYNSEDDTFSGLEATTKNGKPLVAVINTTLLEWDGKASHPWIVVVEIKFEGTGDSGMPDNDTYVLLDKIEEEILKELPEAEGHLNIGRETAENIREIYFACKDFRKPSLVLPELLQQYADKLELNFAIYKDKYWQSFNRFMNVE